MNIPSFVHRWMKFEPALIAAVLLVFALNSCAPTKEAAVVPPSAEKKLLTSTFKILSVNVRHALKGKSDVRRLSKLIKSTAADIVAVQQIERPQEGKSDFDAVGELAKQTEMYDYFGKARYFEGFDSGNALFSTFPVKQTVVQDLPVEEGKVRRSLAFGVIDVGLKEVGVSSTELDDESSSERVKEVVQITSIAQLTTMFPSSSAGISASRYRERPRRKCRNASRQRIRCRNPLKRVNNRSIR